MSIMPQLDFSTYQSQIFWFFICFFLLYFIVSQFVIPGVEEVIRHRYNKVRGCVESAEAACSLLGRMVSDRDLVLESARENAALMISSAIEEVEDAKRIAKDVLSAEIEELFSLAEEYLVNLKKQNYSHFRDLAEELVLLYCDKLLDLESMKAYDIKSVVDVLFQESF